MQKVFWDGESPRGTSFARVLYDMRCDKDGDLLLDSVTEADILEGAEMIESYDALIVPFQKLERSMQLMQKVMERAAADVKPVALQITDPFKKNGVAQIAAIFELSDGQTVSIFFHNPDANPKQIQATDELISWKWVLNKKDITIAVAPEQGKDLNIHEVGRRVMKLAEKNSAAFKRVNAKKAERMKKIEDQKTQIAKLESDLKSAEHDLEVANQELTDAKERLAKAQADAEDRKAAAEAEAKRKAQEEAEAKARAAEEARKAAEEAAKREAAEAARKAAEAAAKASEQGAAEGGDDERSQDRAVLQAFIDHTHPSFGKPGVSKILKPIMVRYVGKDSEMEALCKRASDEIVKAALEKGRAFGGA